MAEPRLKTQLWVQAALRLASVAGRTGVVVRRGDADAGGVLVVLRAPAGVCVLSQARTGEGELAWLRATGPAPVSDAQADAYLARQTARDPDLWIVEFESPDLTPPFAARFL
ncbi:MAG: DUF1491 family protein [Acetobacteraceae bacterium]